MNCKRRIMATHRSSCGCRYPNAAAPGYRLHKLAELMLTIVTGTGLATVVALLLVM